MWFDNIDIRADYRRYDGYPGTVAPTRQDTARRRRIAENMQREHDRRTVLTLPLAGVTGWLVTWVAKMIRPWRRPSIRSGTERLTGKRLRA